MGNIDKLRQFGVPSFFLHGNTCHKWLFLKRVISKNHSCFNTKSWSGILDVLGGYRTLKNLNTLLHDVQVHIQVIPKIKRWPRSAMNFQLDMGNSWCLRSPFFDAWGWWEGITPRLPQKCLAFFRLQTGMRICIYIYVCVYAHSYIAAVLHWNRGCCSVIRTGAFSRSTEEGVMNIQLDLSPAIKALAKVTAWRLLCFLEPKKGLPNHGESEAALMCIILSP